jgi:hypothetical protein
MIGEDIRLIIAITALFFTLINTYLGARSLHLAKKKKE